MVHSTNPRVAPVGKRIATRAAAGSGHRRVHDGNRSRLRPHTDLARQGCSPREHPRRGRPGHLPRDHRWRNRLAELERLASAEILGQPTIALGRIRSAWLHRLHRHNLAVLRRTRDQRDALAHRLRGPPPRTHAQPLPPLSLRPHRPRAAVTLPRVRPRTPAHLCVHNRTAPLPTLGPCPTPHPSLRLRPHHTHPSASVRSAAIP